MPIEPVAWVTGSSTSRAVWIETYHLPHDWLTVALLEPLFLQRQRPVENVTARTRMASLRIQPTERRPDEEDNEA
jgi:hypothetical protein